MSLLGLEFHWDFARLTDIKHTLSGFKTAFYIGSVLLTGEYGCQDVNRNVRGFKFAWYVGQTFEGPS